MLGSTDNRSILLKFQKMNFQISREINFVGNPNLICKKRVFLWLSRRSQKWKKNHINQFLAQKGVRKASWKAVSFLSLSNMSFLKTPHFGFAPAILWIRLKHFLHKSAPTQSSTRQCKTPKYRTFISIARTAWSNTNSHWCIFGQKWSCSLFWVFVQLQMLLFAIVPRISEKQIVKPHWKHQKHVKLAHQHANTSRHIKSTKKIRFDVFLGCCLCAVLCAKLRQNENKRPKVANFCLQLLEDRYIRAHTAQSRNSATEESSQSISMNNLEKFTECQMIRTVWNSSGDEYRWTYERHREDREYDWILLGKCLLDVS